MSPTCIRFSNRVKRLFLREKPVVSTSTRIFLSCFGFEELVRKFAVLMVLFRRYLFRNCFCNRTFNELKMSKKIYSITQFLQEKVQYSEYKFQELLGQKTQKGNTINNRDFLEVSTATHMEETQRSCDLFLNDLLTFPWKLEYRISHRHKISRIMTRQLLTFYSHKVQ